MVFVWEFFRYRDVWSGIALQEQEHKRLWCYENFGTGRCYQIKASGACEEREEHSQGNQSSFCC